MPGLSDDKLDAVRTMVRAAADSALRNLEKAFDAGGESHEMVKLIRGMITAEIMSRRTCAVVFGPYLPLCAPRPEGEAAGPFFPSSTLTRLWGGLKEQAPAKVRAAIDLVSDPDADDDIPTFGFDALCAAAAAGLRSRSNADFAAAADALDRSRPQGAKVFAAYLDLSRVARAALKQLPEWLDRMDEKQAVAARVAFKDAVSVAEDAGPRLMHILRAHLAEPWMVLRLISAAMQQPGDSYAATSELASFGEQLLDDIDARLGRVAAFNAEGGAAAGAAAGHEVNVVALEIAEFDRYIELSHEGPWGARLERQGRSLVIAIEGRLKVVESEVIAALPVQSGSFKKNRQYPLPRLTEELDARQLEQTRAFLAFTREVRKAAELAGCGSMWTKTIEAAAARLDVYVEDLQKELQRCDEGADLERIRRFLEVAAEFRTLAAGDTAEKIERQGVAA